MAKKTTDEVKAEAFPAGEKVKLKDRIEIEITEPRNGLKKGDKIKVHPATAKQFKAMGIAK